MTPLVIPAPSTAAYDAFVTYTQDEGIGYVNPFDVELWVPRPGGEPGGVAAIIESGGAAPEPGLGADLAWMLTERDGIERALVKVHGVPVADWAVGVYRELLAAVDGRVPTDLLAVEGYRWWSWTLAGGIVSAA